MLTSITMPPRALFSPSGGGVGHTQGCHVARAAVNHPQAIEVTAVGRLSTVTNGGRHRGVKLADRSSVQRHEKRVLTTQSSSSCPQAISWPWMLPVTWQLRGRKQASWLPALELGCDGRDVDEFPDLHRRADGQPAAVMARPIGAWKERKWVLRWSPSSRTMTSLPAW